MDIETVNCSIKRLNTQHKNDIHSELFALPCNIM